MSNELQVAIKAAKIAGEKLEYYFQTVLEHEEKEDKSLVTKADLDAESVIVELLQKHFPTHKILSEETGEIGGDSNYTWLIDPLDGTLNFTRGLPNFATSIALVKDNKPIVSVVYNPVTKSLYHAQSGEGAFWNEEKMTVSGVKDPNKAIITFGSEKKFDVSFILFVIILA